MQGELPNFPTESVRLFGERVASAMYDASIQKSIGGLGGCKAYNILNFDEDLREWVMSYVERDELDSVALTYAAMRTAAGDANPEKGSKLIPHYPSSTVKALGEKVMADMCDAVIGLAEAKAEGYTGIDLSNLSEETRMYAETIVAHGGKNAVGICYAAMRTLELREEEAEPYTDPPKLPAKYKKRKPKVAGKSKKHIRYLRGADGIIAIGEDGKAMLVKLLTDEHWKVEAQREFDPLTEDEYKEPPGLYYATIKGKACGGDQCSGLNECAGDCFNHWWEILKPIYKV